MTLKTYILESNFQSLIDKKKSSGENSLFFKKRKKISSTLGLLLILFAERELFKHKRKINLL